MGVLADAPFAVTIRKKNLSSLRAELIYVSLDEK